ncbi:B2 protein [Linum grandiflorum]
MFKTLPTTEAMPRTEKIGGYIFVCNNDTTVENLRRRLFGNFPRRYRDSVRAITPGFRFSLQLLHPPALRSFRGMLFVSPN